MKLLVTLLPLIKYEIRTLLLGMYFVFGIHHFASFIQVLNINKQIKFYHFKTGKNLEETMSSILSFFTTGLNSTSLKT